MYVPLIVMKMVLLRERLCFLTIEMISTTVQSLSKMQAVHSGADLESAISNCMGYRAEVYSVTYSVTAWVMLLNMLIFSISW